MDPRNNRQIQRYTWYQIPDYIPCTDIPGTYKMCDHKLEYRHGKITHRKYQVRYGSVRFGTKARAAEGSRPHPPICVSGQEVLKNLRVGPERDGSGQEVFEVSPGRFLGGPIRPDP